MRIPLLALGLLFLPALAVGQDVETKYLQLQEAYSQRLLDLEQSFENEQRELLNKFILALVRTEQSYREQGNLEGVVFSRDLRESLLLYPKNLESNEEWPQGLKDMFQELIRLRDEKKTEGQAKLDELNRVLLKTLEPYKVEFTRRGNLEKAIEIRNLQSQLSVGLGLEAAPSHMTSPIAAPTPAIAPEALQDPNTYAFLLEPEAYKDTPDIRVRQSFAEPEPVVEGGVEATRQRFNLTGGNVTFGQNQLEIFRAMASRNQIFNLEIAVSPSWEPQGTAGQPAVIFRWGPSVQEANLAVTQERNRLWLYMKTTNPPDGRENFRVDLGLVRGGVPVHVMVTFRGNEVAIYRDGIVTQRLRGNQMGSLTNWAPSPLVFSKPSERRYQQGQRLGEARGVWHGSVYLMSLKGVQETHRQLDENYNRFKKMIEP